MAVIEVEKLSAEERAALVADISADLEKEESTEIIEVTQLPIIRQQLLKIKEQFEHEVENALSLECNEKTVKETKAVRARLSKIFNAIEDKRKQVKKQILAPYEEFEQIYKDCVTSIYKPCDDKLKARIDEVESSLKKAKIRFAADYFEEKCVAADIDFIPFERCPLKIGLSTSVKSIREQVDAFVTKVAEELVLIEAQENSAEVLNEYRQLLNVAQAINKVNERHRAVEEQEARLEARRVADEKRAAAVEKVTDAVEEISAPTAEPIPDEEPQMFEVTFTVRGTLDEIRALKSYMTENCLDFRNGGDNNG